MASVAIMSEHAILNEAMFDSGSHSYGVREHSGGLLHEVKLTIGDGVAPTVHGR